MSEPACGTARPDNIKKEKNSKEFYKFFDIAIMDKYSIVSPCRQSLFYSC
jgi:hypothetical protein